jgi:DnaJ homolog subfamily C member 2
MYKVGYVSAKYPYLMWHIFFFSMIDLTIELPVAPSDWDQSKDSQFHKRIAKSVKKPIEPAGHAFMARVKRFRTKRTLEEDYNLTQALLDAAGDNDDGEEEEEESKHLLASDPAKWKEQDHYAVLGLSKKRYLANDEDIKRAYRRKVLKHHPDKKAHLGGNDNFFKCIQKAWEILTDRKKRRQFDSCDPTFDDSLPPAKLSGDFFKVYTRVFESESRFSKKPNVPSVGDMDTSRGEVEAFYQFWFSFDSWRTFEMLDEESTDSAGSREEKRWLDRKNVAQRKKYKKEDNLRINRLVEQAFSQDPRIKKFKDEEKFAKGAKKREREAQERAEAEKAAKLAEEERLKKEKADLESKELKQNEKKEKDAAKNAIKKERKTIRRLMRDNNNFLPANASADDSILQVGKIEAILANSDVDYLEGVRIKLEKSLSLGPSALSKIIEEEQKNVAQ